MEHDRQKLWDISGKLVEIGLLYLIISATFSDGIKREVKKKQGGRCWWCGQQALLQIHHRVPQRDKGSSEVTNGVGLCDACHDEWDDKSYEGILFPLDLMPFKAK